MVVAASQRLEASGEVATPILVQRMTDSLAVARTDDEAAAAIRAGRLVEDLTPATLGLDSFGFRSAAERDSKATGSKQAERARSARERAVAETADLATELRAEADEARAEADRVELAAKEASKAADEAERRAEAAQRKAEQAREARREAVAAVCRTSASAGDVREPAPGHRHRSGSTGPREVC